MSEFLMFSVVFITFGCIMMFFAILVFLMYKEIVSLIKKPGDVRKPRIPVEEISRTPVEEIMQTDLVTVEVKTTVIEAIQKMREEYVKYLPVLKNSKLTGVVTDGDVLAAIYNEKIDPVKLTVEKIMTKKPVTIKRTSTVKEALDKIFKHKVRRLPVLDGNALVGLVSLTDIEYYTGQPGTEIRGIHRDFFEA